MRKNDDQRRGAAQGRKSFVDAGAPVVMVFFGGE
jgi:hypothetical protein